MSSDVRRNLTIACSGGGSATDMRERDRATAWLLSHVDEALPAAIAAAAQRPSDAALIELLGRFARSEATPALARAFALGDPVRRYAAVGLGVSPDPAAESTLLAAMRAADPEVVAAALSGLEASGNARYCTAIMERVGDTHAEVRWMAVHAGARLGCLDREALGSLATSDADEAVRRLAAELAVAK